MRRAGPRRFGGMSQLTLAKTTGIGQGTVSKAIAALVFLLPGAWSHVFSDRHARRSNQTRQALFPLPDSLRGDRSELVLRLQSVGMPDDDVASLTGTPLANVQEIRRAGARARPDSA
jgi:hypothetical protein